MTSPADSSSTRFTSETKTVLDFERVTLAYGDFTVLADLSMSVRASEVVAVMGGSGSGKTTLMRAATGQLGVKSGELKVFGHPLSGIGRVELERLRQRMGVLFQHGALFTDLDVFENVAFPLREHTRLNEAEIADKVLHNLEAVGLRAAAHLKLSEVSGGMARRVALARAIVREPELVFYDEPFAGLDPISMGVAARLIRSLSDKLGCASVVITHDVPESFEIADTVYIVGQGKLKASGSPESLNESTDPYVRQFLDGAPDGPVAFDYPLTDAFEKWCQTKGVKP
ncbi:ABC transporter ATP-binding protein [Orrella daihaiensis]|uniref:ABC transporter ATP-binding protein n=1 Tax=Orrella daihaiensis TaxID=2782176 RepID=A0ABY4ANH1_9BURK|nr:ABC transporter ATP-binding protein [Orrella daihaiensis]UOD50605.1 ABC transporter ATP-binding protein [Orrella daihaiensis]